MSATIPNVEQWQAMYEQLEESNPELHKAIEDAEQLVRGKLAGAGITPPDDTEYLLAAITRLAVESNIDSSYHAELYALMGEKSYEEAVMRLLNGWD